MKLFRTISLLGIVTVLFYGCAGDMPEQKTEEFLAAPTPPMGWNSFDAYDCRINEEEFLRTVDYMAENLLEYGWEYAVIDYIWWHPAPGNWDSPRRKGHPNLRYKANGEQLYPEYTNMDEYGRLMPSVERFPSAADGKGFKAIADYVHSKGMKFGIHIMRGIHRKAVFDNTPVMGSNAWAKDIAEPWDTCKWCNHMYGVDASKEGAQEYYNALFELYASWGVDFVKADDMMFYPYHGGEVELIHNAIKNSGRPMVLSLSCGEAPLSQAGHLTQYANMWRVSADFWDEWNKLVHMFDLQNSWSSHIQENHWPDADMLPVGKISLDDRPHGPERMSEFTNPELHTLFTLWSISRSPLMLGADLISSGDSLLYFLQNEDIISMNQNTTDNRQVYNKSGHVCWIATDSVTGDYYIALFNKNDQKEMVSFEFEHENIRGAFHVKDLWNSKDMGVINDKIAISVEPHGAKAFRLSRAD